jgi:transcriptional regulator with XRE-family HTH domain
LTQVEVARRAGVLRKQVQALENGANVTLETIRRIAPVIPNLRRVSLGGLEIVAENADLEEARRAALDLFDVARRLVAALGASPNADPARRESATGAVRYTPENIPTEPALPEREGRIRPGTDLAWEPEGRIRPGTTLTPELERRLRHLEARYFREEEGEMEAAESATGAVRYTPGRVSERKTAERLQRELEESRGPKKGDA